MSKIDNQHKGMEQRFQFTAVNGEFSKVDKKLGRISGVSLISTGEAKGHGVMIDERSLETALDALESGPALPAFITHNGAGWDDRITREIGTYENYRIEDDQLKADFQAFDSFKEDDKRDFNRLFELAQKIPERFGVSIVFMGDRVWATDDGDLPMFDDKQPENAIYDEPSIRVKQIDSADFVDSPAANERGLFAKIDNSTNSNMTQKQLTEKVTELESEKVTLSASIEELTKKLSEKEADAESKITELQTKADETATELSAKVEAFTALEAEKTALSEKLEAAETELGSIKGELSAAQAEVIRLKALINGEPNGGQRTSEGGDDYVPSREARDKRIKEYAQEHGIEEFQAVIQLSRKEPKLFTI